MLPALEQLRRRKVVQWTAAYVGAAWVLLQVADVIGTQWDWPVRMQRGITLVLALGVLPAIALAWYHGGRGRQRVTWTEAALLLAFVAVIASAGVVGTRERGGIDLGPLPRIAQMTQVTNLPGLEVHPTLSPDGRTVAYAAGPAGNMRVYVQQLGGGRALPLAESLAEHQQWPQWSADGTRILFQSGRARDQQTGSWRNATGGSVYTVPALGGAPRRIVDALATAPALAPALSPDGTSIAFSRGDTLFLMPAAGGAARPLARLPEVHGPRWSPDGTRIAYVHGDARFTFGGTDIGNISPLRIGVVQVQDGATHEITSGEWLDTSPVWTPDGRALWFVSNRGGSRDVYRVAVQPNGAAGGAPERFTSGVNAHTIDLSRDGRTLVYASYNAYSHIWSLPIPTDGSVLSSRDATQLTFANEVVEGLALSPDGRWLAYDSNRSGDPEIWKIATSGGEAEQLTTAPGGDFVQDWARDGTIAFHAYRGASRDIFTMRADGTAIERVTDGQSSEANPEKSPDGNRIVFQSDAAGSEQLYMTARERPGAPWSAPVRLAHEGSAGDPAWSPDGALIAFLSGQALHVIAPDGTGARTVVTADLAAGIPPPRFAQWAPDSRTLYYKAYDEANNASLWSVAVTGGRPRLLVRFDAGMPSLRREFATDGTRFYFSIAQHQSDIWAATLQYDGRAPAAAR